MILYPPVADGELMLLNNHHLLPIYKRTWGMPSHEMDHRMFRLWTFDEVLAQSDEPVIFGDVGIGVPFFAISSDGKISRRFAGEEIWTQEWADLQAFFKNMRLFIKDWGHEAMKPSCPRCLLT